MQVTLNTTLLVRIVLYISVDEIIKLAKRYDCYDDNLNAILISHIQNGHILLDDYLKFIVIANTIFSKAKPDDRFHANALMSSLTSCNTPVGLATDEQLVSIMATQFYDDERFVRKATRRLPDGKVNKKSMTVVSNGYNYEYYQNSGGESDYVLKIKDNVIIQVYLVYT